MHFEIHHFIARLMILCSVSHVTRVKGMIGENIETVRDDKFRFIASIQRTCRLSNQFMFNHFCTGTLISSGHVLTAEHCLQNESKDNMQVAIGSADFRFGTRYAIVWWISYDQWARGKPNRYVFRNNDIAIIKLSQEIPSIVQALISNTATLGLYGLQATAVGWGNTESGIISPQMKAVNLTVLTNSECESRVIIFSGQRYEVPLRYVCTAANPPVLLHYGDSGGPLLYNNEIIAISISTVPMEERRVDPNKINIHLVTQYYEEFIVQVKSTP